MTTYEVVVQITPWPEGGFLAEAVGLQGCWVVSDTVDQSVDDIREAVQLWVQASRQQNWPLPTALKEARPDICIRTVLPVGIARSIPSSRGASDDSAFSAFLREPVMKSGPESTGN